MKKVEKFYFLLYQRSYKAAQRKLDGKILKKVLEKACFY